MITLLRSIFLARISLATFLLLSVPVWIYGAVPRFLALRSDFTYEADIISRQKLYDAQVADFGPETLSVGKLFFDVVGKQNDTLFVRGIFNARGATKGKGRSVARIYGVSSRTRENLKGAGDRDRTGYLFAPGNVGKRDFVSWPVHYNSPAAFTFKGETEIEGLSVHQYEAEFQTNDPPLIGFYRDEGDVPRNLTFNIRLTYWVEPISGRLVTYEDRAIGSSNSPGQEPQPYSNSFYTPSRDSVLAQVQEATYEKWKAIIVSYIIPSAVALLAIFLLISLWHGSHHPVGKEAKESTSNLPIVIPAIALLVLVLITLVVWRFAQRITDQQEQLWFSQEIDSMERAITMQVDSATRILENGLKQGFATDTKERFDWRAYVDSIDSDQHYPGLEGVGFAAYIRSSERDAFLASARRTDPTYGISPPGNRTEYAPVMHFETLTKKEKPALGIDLLSDPNLSASLLAARDTGSSVLSPKVVIARDQNGYEQIGVMLCTPVYQGGVRLSTVQERRDNITGYLYHLIRVSEMVEGALTNHNPAFRLQVFDGIWEYDPDKERELYARKTSNVSTEIEILSKTRVAYLLDRAWTVNFAVSSETGLTSAQRNLPTFALIIGLVFSILFSGIVYFLTTSRRRAEGIAQEMTRQLSDEKGQVEKQRALLSLLLEHLPFGVFLSNAGTGEILLVNGVGKELLGNDAASVLGRDSASYLSPFFKADGQPYPKAEFPLDMTLSSSHVASKDDIVLRLPSGKEIFIRATSALVQQDSGTERGTDTILILEDITKEQEINRAKTDFVSLASHQLLTPLTAIGWYVEMLLSGDAGELNTDQKQYLDEVSQGNKRMVTLVTDLLNVSRVDLGNLAVHPTPTDLPKTADSVLFELHSQIETKKLSILKEYDGTLTTFPADTTILRILLQNLLSNAVKYTPEGGTVRISITKGIQDVNVIVADTGYGIPKAEQEKIFSKFFRAENARVNVAEGNGLGLYIVKFAVEQAGGTIRFESEEGKGTTFFVTFPATGMLERKGTKTLQ